MLVEKEIPLHQIFIFLHLGDELVSFPVYIEDLNGGIFLQIFPEFGNVHIHASGIEIAVVLPNGSQSVVPVEHLVFVVT